jgi:hypothetical protein
MEKRNDRLCIGGGNENPRMIRDCREKSTLPDGRRAFFPSGFRAFGLASASGARILLMCFHPSAGSRKSLIGGLNRCRAPSRQKSSMIDSPSSMRSGDRRPNHFRA